MSLGKLWVNVTRLMMDCSTRSWVTRVRASGTKHLFVGSLKLRLSNLCLIRLYPGWQHVKHLWPACRWQYKSRWRKCNWRVWSLLHTHRSIMPLSWQRRWVTARGCSLPARTRRHRLAHRPTVLAHFCGTSLCPHRHLDVFFLFRAALSLVSVVCVKILLSALRPLSGRRVSTGGTETETLTLFMAR